MKRAEPSEQGVSKDPPLAPWETAVVWVAASATTFGWLPLYAIAWTLVAWLADAVDRLADLAHELRVRRSCARAAGP